MRFVERHPFADPDVAACKLVEIAVAPFTILLIAATTFPAISGEISGTPRIVDGDTVMIGQTKIRLSGIDAPETDQLCLDAKGERWACGIAARDQLIKHSNEQPWHCDITGTDQYDNAQPDRTIHAPTSSPSMKQLASDLP